MAQKPTNKEISLCTDLTLNPLFLSILQLKNIRTIPHNIKVDSLQGKIILSDQEHKHNSPKINYQLETIDKCNLNRQSSPLPLCSVRIKKKKEIKRKKLEFKDVGFRKRIKLYRFQWEKPRI